MKTNELDLSFPVAVLYGSCVRTEPDWNSLTSTTSAGLKNGMYRDALIIDTQGLTIKLKDAKKMYGIGFLWGYNIFLNQKIKVHLILSEKPFFTSLNSFKKMLEEIFRTNHGWASRGDFVEFKKSIRRAHNIEQIINIIK